MKYILPADHAAQVPDVHPSQRQAHITPIRGPLYVVTMISNPMRYASRLRLYRAFEKMVADAGAVLYTVEIALRDAHFEVTSHHNPHHIQLRSPSMLWHKENAINIGIQRLPADWDNVAWIDGDVAFARTDWAQETLQLLQTYPMIQMFKTAIDLGPKGEPFLMSTSFAHDWFEDRYALLENGVNLRQKTSSGVTLNAGGEPAEPYAPYYADIPAPMPGSPIRLNRLHSGYAWAARRSALSDLGGLGDIAILGSADHHMAYALVGEVDRSIHHMTAPSYKSYWREWQRRAARHIRGNLGFMDGTITHGFHGPKFARRYQDRWHIINLHKYDYRRDVKYDVQGLLTWTGNKPALERDVRHYFALRDEDATSLAV